jgi:hypothetical protein
MSNKKKINKLIEKFGEDQFFMDELHSGNYWTDDFDKKFQQKYPETIPNTNQLIQLLKNSIIDTSDETYQELKNLTVIFFSFNSFNDLRNTLQDIVVDDIYSYDEFMYTQIYSDLRSQFDKVFKFN